MPSREQGHGQVLGKFLSLFYCDKWLSSDKGVQNVYLDLVLGFRISGPYTGCRSTPYYDDVTARRDVRQGAKEGWQKSVVPCGSVTTPAKHTFLFAVIIKVTLEPLPADAGANNY